MQNWHLSQWLNDFPLATLHRRNWWKVGASVVFENPTPVISKKWQKILHLRQILLRILPRICNSPRNEQNTAWQVCHISGRRCLVGNDTVLWRGHTSCRWLHRHHSRTVCSPPDHRALQSSGFDPTTNHGFWSNQSYINSGCQSRNGQHNFEDVMKIH